MSNLPNAPTVGQRPKFSVAITTTGYKNLINNTLGDPDRAKRFIASITSAVAINPALQECEAGTILAGALLGESLNLSPSPQLGQYYLVPFKTKAKLNRNNELIQPETVKAQFVLGYKGYIQLALRSGAYADLDVIEIREGEYKGKNPLTGKPQFSFIEDDDAREQLPVIGYMAFFEYLNGFRKIMYWSKSKMMNHADTYSPAYSASAHKKIMNGEIADKDMWKYSSFWYKDFDGMAKKTLLRQLISKWGIMSTEIQIAFANDGSMSEVVNSSEIVTTPEDNLPVALPEAETVVDQVNLADL